MPAQRRRPVVGITGPANRLAWGRLAAWWWIKRAGGRPRWLAPTGQPLPDDLEAVLVTGGSDIDPSLYLQPGGPWVAPDPQRDQFELAALELARRHGLPVLGICRGAQLINVAAGGTLHRDITELRRVTSNRPTLLPNKPVEIEPGSLLADVLGTKRLKVNSLHHQAVDRLGEGLNVVARDEDRIVQAIEAHESRLCLGVQWHPEYLGWRRAQRRLFAALVDAARR